MIIDIIVMNAIFQAELLELVAQPQCEWGALENSSRYDFSLDPFYDSK